MTESVKKVAGIPIGFDIVKIGKTLVKLNDGNYIEITCLPVKILKQPGTDPEGNTIFAVAVTTPNVYWTKEQVLQMKEKEVES